MTDDHDHDDDHDDLRALLRAADPGRALPPLTDTDRTRALEAAMTEHDPDRTPDGYATREAGTRHRNPLTWVVAAAAVLVVAGVGWAGVRSLSGPERVAGTEAGAPTSTAPTADPDPTTDAPGPTGETVRLGVPDALGARCMVPDARVLQNQDLAFEGTVTEAGDAGLTFEVDTWFRGGEATSVEVDPVDDRLRRLLLAPEFVEGDTYLVSASGGSVTLCGFSGEADPRLRALYDRAFS
ncbi:hypothetical protein [Nocardioides sp. AX2bis]|uniref:hypothetical protein n=1 Tax=Nocardioides sp. AX2bis TaxID=2653157 RepID=UPI0012F0B068|nr:hypothetical protein [Nocardioides sp. AX2bis]VXA94272.1 conserved hypothetical protein [Nocardioides sp. AX2bis]